jgi:outer membrane protein insertion porin family
MEIVFPMKRWLLFLTLLCVGVKSVQGGDTVKTNRAELSVSGYGFFGDRELKRMVRLLQKSDARPEYFDANFVEDAVLLFFSKMSRNGRLKPLVEATLHLRDGTILTQSWTKRIEEPLPRPLEISRARFRIQAGPLFYFESLDFEGLTVVSVEDARHYFMETDALLPLKKSRIYSPERLRSGLASLIEVLERAGYESAQSVTNHIEQNDETGAVRARLVINEGRKSIVRSVRREVFYGTNTEPSEVTTFHPHTAYSKLWQQDLVQSFKRTFYYFGYADTRVDVKQVLREEVGDNTEIDLLATVKTGPILRLGSVRFEGLKSTDEDLLHKRVKLTPGQLLNPIEAENGRYRLSKLGAFDSIEMRYENVDAVTRDVLYKVKEGRQIELSALFGFGSYELLRGGFDLDQFNVFGRAHHSHLRAVQSFKASTVDYTYTMPEFGGRNVDVVFNADWLRREEISFTREEFGGGLGARHYFPSINSDFGLRYNYQVLNALDVGPTLGPTQANVGAVIADLKHDRRDNPLYPHRGYKIFGVFELASDYLAGDVNYQRFESAGSFHLPIGKARWMHFGANHGFVFALDTPARDLPFNRRFFPGGENSVRGYQQGEAAPRDAGGRVVGAESYMSGNVEFEQGLTRSLAMVFFFDAVGFAESIDNYPFNSGLYSVGAGFRWKTLIGPARLEYGYNLNRRPYDPVGTIHFSIGFPF